MRILILLFSVVFAISCTSTNRSVDRDIAQADEEESSSSQTAPRTNGPYDDCDQRFLFEKNNEMQWACTDNYVHIYSTKPVTHRPTRDLKIGAFNLYHLGDDQSRLKSFDAMADIMNQWDLVGATEIMPLPTDPATENRKLRELFNGRPEHARLPPGWRVVEPGYYKLLKALQAKDESWSLIFQPVPEGEGSSGEMAGFYYRSRKVQPRAWNYCPRSGLTDKINPNVMGLNFGCLAQVPVAQAQLISRRAFATLFKSGQFDFIALVSHTRFRPASAADQQRQQQEVCSRYPAGQNCSISKDKIGRFYEVKAIADQLPAMEQFDRDIIFMGDFNLDLSPSVLPAWTASLSASPGYQVLQSQNTSLSLPTQSLANSYDHFIVRPSTLTECDLNSIKNFDFTKAGEPTKDRVMRRLGLLLDPATHEQTRREQLRLLDRQLRFERRGNSLTARLLNDEEKARLSADIERAIRRLSNDKFWILREYLSDHVPIQMKCSTRRDDD